MLRTIQINGLAFHQNTLEILQLLEFDFFFGRLRLDAETWRCVKFNSPCYYLGSTGCPNALIQQMPQATRSSKHQSVLCIPDRWLSIVLPRWPPPHRWAPNSTRQAHGLLRWEPLCIKVAIAESKSTRLASLQNSRHRRGS